VTELRDARLCKAMDEAPDARLQPHPRSRDAIRAAAHAAVQPWWRRWGSSAVGRRTQWTAAFATLMLASVVTLLWQGQEIPGARPEPPGVDQPAPVAASVSVPVPAPRPSAPPAAAAESARVHQHAGHGERSREPAAAPDPLARAEQRAAPTAEAAPALADVAGTAAAPMAKAQPAPAEDVRPQAAPAAPAPPPSPAAAAPAPAAVAALRAAPAAPAWTQVRIEADGHSVVVPRAQAGALPSLVARMLLAPAEPAAATGPAVLRLELAQGDEAAGVLELAGARWRWMPLRGAQQARMLRPDPVLAAALREEAERLLRR
jgi:hypothetical protein